MPRSPANLAILFKYRTCFNPKHPITHVKNGLFGDVAEI